MSHLKPQPTFPLSNSSLHGTGINLHGGAVFAPIPGHLHLHTYECRHCAVQTPPYQNCESLSAPPPTVGLCLSLPGKFRPRYTSATMYSRVVLWVVFRVSWCCVFLRGFPIFLCGLALSGWRGLRDHFIVHLEGARPTHQLIGRFEGTPMVQFSLKLEDNRVDKWSSHYLDYRKLKKAIKQLVRSRQAANIIARRYSSSSSRTRKHVCVSCRAGQNMKRTRSRYEYSSSIRKTDTGNLDARNALVFVILIVVHGWYAGGVLLYWYVLRFDLPNVLCERSLCPVVQPSSCRYR